MVVNKANLREKKGELALFETFDIVDKSIYAQLLWKNIIIKINPVSNNMEMFSFDDDYHFKHCISEEDKIYFADNLGEALVRYDIKTRSRVIYPLDIHEKDNNNIAAIEKYNGNIFVVSRYEGVISVFDTVKETMVKEYAVQQLIRSKYNEAIEYVQCWKIDTCLYLKIVADGVDEVLKFNLAKMHFEELSENVFPNQMLDAYYFDDKVYILKDEYNLVIWDIKNHETEKICMLDLYHLLGANKDKCLISTLAVTKKNIWLFPTTYGEDIYIYDIQNKIVIKYDEYPKDFCYMNVENWSKYANIKEREDSIYVAAKLSNYYLIINVETGQGIWKPTYTYDFSGYYSYLVNKVRLKERRILTEREIPLKRYLEYIPQNTKNISLSENVGKEIWDKLK